MRQVVECHTNWCVEAGGFGTKLRLRASTSVSNGESCWEDRLPMALFLKFICSSWRTQHVVLLKFLVVHISRKSFLNERLEYGGQFYQCNE